MSVPFDQDKKPVKGILKNTSSFDTNSNKTSTDHRCSLDKEMKWDEMNILATYHPADKDYGHDKINEPPTPYNRSDVDGAHSGDEDGAGFIDPQLLVDSLTMTSKPKLFTKADTESDEEEDETSMTDEQKEHKQAFKLHRKHHYNEFQAVQLARQLLQEEEDEEEDGQGDGAGVASSPSQPPQDNNDVDMETGASN